MPASAVVTLIYGTLVLAGGIIGYAKAKSLPSLISGFLFGILLIVAAIAISQGSPAASYGAAILMLFLAGFFGLRFYTKRKWIPAGLMMILSIVSLVLLLTI